MQFIKHPFGPELYKTSISSEFYKKLLETNKNEIKLNGKIKSTSIESYQYSYEDIQLYKEEIFYYIDGYIKEVQKIRNLKPYNFKYNLDELWINYQKTKDNIQPHFHAYDISFVIYLNIPDEIKKEKSPFRGTPNGSITFSYGQNIKKFNKNELEFFEILNSYTAPITQYTELPSMGDMFIFPSYLMHYVSPFLSENVERISISGNISLINNNQKNII